MKHTISILVAALVSLCVSGCSKSENGGRATNSERTFEGKTLEVFVGAASKPATEEAVAAFETETGAKLEVHFGGSGKMLSDLKLSQRGDIYFPGSSDYMEIAIKEGLVDRTSEQRIVYLVTARCLRTAASGNAASRIRNGSARSRTKPASM